MIWKIITIIAFIIAVSGFIARFEPKISVSPSFSFNPQNALLTNFEILNGGNTSIKNVNFAIAIKNIKTSDGLEVIGNPDFKSRLIEANNMVPLLGANEKYTVSFPVQSFNVGNNVSFADLALVINFAHPLFSFKRVEKKFRYKTSKDTEGKFHWAPQPLCREFRGQDT